MSALPRDEIAEIRRLRSQGRSLSEIARITGRGRTTIHSHTKGIALPFGPLKRGSRPKIMRNVAIRMKAQGMTYRATAERLGVVVSAVYRAVNKPERRAA